MRDTGYLQMIYLDHAATTPLRPEVREAMGPYLGEVFGNPSGIHEVSRRAKNAVEAAREAIADLLGAARPLEVVFTGGGTESDNLAVAGRALAGAGRGGVVTVSTEHDAVLETARWLAKLGCDVGVVPVGAGGTVSPEEVAAHVGAETVLVSVMVANNETGALQSVAEVVERVRARRDGVTVHTDAVQAFLTGEVTVASTGADLISLSGHKLGAPKGVGVLYVRDGVDLEPVIHGGGQELGRRSGTHNVAAIVGMAEAMRLAAAQRETLAGLLAAERDAFEERLAGRRPDVAVTAAGVARTPQHSHVRFPGIGAETLLIRLDRAGVAASSGSACHSGAIEPSHVLEAMGLSPTQARQGVRFSFGWVTRPGDGAAAADLVASVVNDLAEAPA